MAICFPGMASRVKRAATSLTRIAPRVMTTNWITTRIANRITPTVSDPLVTNSLKAQMTFPAARRACSIVAPSPPAVRIRRVEATFSTSRPSVASSSSEGNTLRSSGREAWITATRINADTARFPASSTSMIGAGSGTMSTNTSPAASAGRSTPRCRSMNRPMLWIVACIVIAPSACRARPPPPAAVGGAAGWPPGP